MGADAGIKPVLGTTPVPNTTASQLHKETNEISTHAEQTLTQCHITHLRRRIHQAVAIVQHNGLDTGCLVTFELSDGALQPELHTLALVKRMQGGTHL